VRRNSFARAGSSGSIDNEVSKKLHFRPISAAPLTPPKCNPTNGKTIFKNCFLIFQYLNKFLFIFKGQILKPEVVAGTAKNLSQLFNFQDDESICLFPTKLCFK